MKLSQKKFPLAKIITVFCRLDLSGGFFYFISKINYVRIHLMEDIIIVIKKISKTKLKQLAEKRFGDLIKAVVDVKRGIMALGGELHADEEAELLKNGSEQSNLWGINLYPDESKEKWIEFDSIINIRPSQNNRSRDIENQEIKEKIKNIIKNLTE